MQRFAVIGLGRFGSRLAANLAAAGQEVIAIDRSERIVEEMRDRVTLAVALDATDEQALRSQGVDQADVAVVGIGNDFEAASLTTVILKQIGVDKVISRAATPTSAHILARIGADEIVNPEDESADRWAVRLANPWFLSHIELDADYSIVDIETPSQWIGKTPKELRLRSDFGIHIVAIRKRAPSTDPDGAMVHTGLRIPMPDQPLQEQDILMVMGPDEKLTDLPKQE